MMSKQEIVANMNIVSAGSTPSLQNALIWNLSHTFMSCCRDPFGNRKSAKWDTKHMMKMIFRNWICAKIYGILRKENNFCQFLYFFILISWSVVFSSYFSSEIHFSHLLMGIRCVVIVFTRSHITKFIIITQIRLEKSKIPLEVKYCWRHGSKYALPIWYSYLSIQRKDLFLPILTKAEKISSICVKPSKTYMII